MAFSNRTLDTLRQGMIGTYDDSSRCDDDPGRQVVKPYNGRWSKHHLYVSLELAYTCNKSILRNLSPVLAVNVWRPLRRTGIKPKWYREYPDCSGINGYEPPYSLFCFKILNTIRDHRKGSRQLSNFLANALWATISTGTTPIKGPCHPVGARKCDGISRFIDRLHKKKMVIEIHRSKQFKIYFYENSSGSSQYTGILPWRCIVTIQ